VNIVPDDLFSILNKITGSRNNTCQGLLLVRAVERAFVWSGGSASDHWKEGSGQGRQHL